MNPEIQQVFYTNTELASMLRVGRKTVERFSSQNKIPGRFRVGRKILWHKAEVDAWFQTGGIDE